jgi:hypothetical protein
MSIVSNTGPLIAQAKVDPLGRLGALFGTVHWLSDELIDLATALAGE